MMFRPFSRVLLWLQGNVVDVVVGLGIEVEWHEWLAKQSRRAVEGATGDGDD